MSLVHTSPVTGGAQTGFTSPTYTIALDRAPSPLAVQYAVTAIGGTQVGVDVSSGSRPFTYTFTKPAVVRSLPPVDASGVVRNVPRNTYTWLFRKGVTPLSGQQSIPAQARLQIEVPAGADLADAAGLRALTSLMIGVLNQNSAGLGDTLISNVV
jgi:hypothetical protein